ncbi:MAG: hypothetical protein J6R24_01690, partial [Clostridia bacterium]|nr:hypothetical protein [Clostridia bacterium]
MKKLSKLLLTLALAGLMGLSMAACAPTNPGSSTETPGSSTEAPASSEEAPGTSEEAPGTSEEAPSSSEEDPAPAPGPAATQLRIEAENTSKVTVVGEPNQAGSDWIEVDQAAASGNQSLGFLGVAGNQV